LPPKEKRCVLLNAVICREHGCKPLHARWGEEALEMFRQNRPVDLFLTDLL
jgi:hypothetical protein